MDVVDRLRSGTGARLDVDRARAVWTADGWCRVASGAQLSCLWERHAGRMVALSSDGALVALEGESTRVIPTGGDGSIGSERCLVMPDGGVVAGGGESVFLFDGQTRPAMRVMTGSGVWGERGDALWAVREPADSARRASAAAWTHAGIVRVLERHGRSLEGTGDTPHEGANEEPVLAACYAASASDVQLLGAAPGRETDKLVRPLRVVPSANEPLAEVGGVNVHGARTGSARWSSACRARTARPTSTRSRPRATRARRSTSRIPRR